MAFNRIQMNASRPLRFPIPMELHSSMLQNLLAEYPQCNSYGPCRKYGSTLSGASFKPKHKVSRLSSRDHGRQLGVTIRCFSDALNCPMYFLRSNCDLRPKMLPCQLVDQRSYSSISRKNILEAKYANWLNRTAVANGKEVRGRSSLKLNSNDGVNDGDIEDARKRIIGEIANFGEGKKVRSNEAEKKKENKTGEKKKVRSNGAEKKKENKTGEKKKVRSNDAEKKKENKTGEKKKVRSNDAEKKKENKTGEKKKVRSNDAEKKKENKTGEKKKVRSNDAEKKKENKIGEKKALSSRGAGTGSSKASRKKNSVSPTDSELVKSNASLSKKKRAAGGSQLVPLWPPSGKSVMVVESVTKAKTIQKYLGDMFDVLPSHGHVRDLAARAGSVRPLEDFEMVWEVPAPAWKHINAVKVALSRAQNLILATDPDREGEAIAWHLIEMLQQQNALVENINVARVAFHEITDVAIKDALSSPRNLDLNLVNAYLARRALDYLIGFNISPLLWRKLPGCQSAGRVQSSALSLICDREMEIEQFKPQEYWTVEADFSRSATCSSEDEITIASHLSYLDLKKLSPLSISSSEDAESIKKRLVSAKFSLLKSKKSKIARKPPHPYITSTLQQDSSNKLNFTALHTMKLAQKLFEGVVLPNGQPLGLITYMRTDGLHVSKNAATEIQSLIRERYGDNFAPKVVRTYFKKVKNAQEAHEAIRPTNIRMLPSSLRGILDDDSLKLYSLIWTQTVACQMEPAIRDLVEVQIGSAAGDMVLRSSASKICFLGYQAVYKDAEASNTPQSNDEENNDNEDFETLIKLERGEELNLKNVSLVQHHTKPPGHYSEASLVKTLEELGIGRPSTYASIPKILQDRKYVTMKSRALHAEFRGRMVSSFLSRYFEEISDYSFTANMENELDNVSAGMTEWKGLLKDYFSRFTTCANFAKNIHIRQIEMMLERKFGHILFKFLQDSDKTCPRCLDGTLIFKISRFGRGYFFGCDRHPECTYIVENVVREEGDHDDVDISVDPTPLRLRFEPKLLGHHPRSNDKVFAKKGPYGYYVQLGDDPRDKAYTPKRCSVPQNQDVHSLTLEDAIDLLEFPLNLGNHPEDKKPVLVCSSTNKTGFSVRHGKDVAVIPKTQDPKAMTLEIALQLFAKKKKNEKRKTKERKAQKCED